jgi:transposase
MRAKYWDEKDLLAIMVGDTMGMLMPPLDKTIHLIGDTTRNAKRGKKQPLAYTTKMGRFEPFVYGQSILVMIGNWGSIRIPVAVAVIDPQVKGDQNKQFRQMLANFKPPAWCQRVIVEADAGFAAKATMSLIISLKWDYVFSLPRTWKLANGTHLSNLAKHLPKKYYHRVASYKPNGRRRDYWIYRRRAVLNLLGDVTIILSKRRFNDAYKNIKLIVTNLNEATTGEILSHYARRWGVELTFKELKSGLHMGQMQVTKESHRVVRAILLPIMAYLLLLRLYAKDDAFKQGFSIFKLKEHFINDVWQQHLFRSDQRWLSKLDKFRAAA